MKSPNHSQESLQKLLALKRHEQPPPGFFNNFSTKVIARLQADPAPSLWDRFKESLQPSPAGLWTLGGSLAVLMVGGVMVAALNHKSESDPNQSLAAESLIRSNQPTNTEPNLFDRFKLDPQPAAFGSEK